VYFEVVGESFHTKSFVKLVGWAFGGHRQKCTAEVVLEDDNSHDRNAVKVMICGLDVGHFPRQEAAEFRKFLNRDGIPDQSFLVDAIIVGGRPGENFGVFLDIEKIKKNRTWHYDIHHSGRYDDFKPQGRKVKVEAVRETALDGCLKALIILVAAIGGLLALGTLINHL